MRFGVCGGACPTNMNDLTAAFCAEVKALGYSGVYCRFSQNNPFTTTPAEAQRARAILADGGVELYQVTGYWQCLIHPDEAVRAEAVKTVQAALRLAGWLGARAIDTGPGSMSPNGPWFPHPDNWTATSRRQLIRSLRECASAASDAGVYLSLEAHQLVTLQTPEITRDILDAVDSPWVVSDLDAANWITLDNVFATGPAIDHMFDVLGTHIISGHAKDTQIEDRLNIHISSCAAGTGILDFKTYIQRMESLNPAYPLIVEGASYEEWPASATFLHQTARDLGIQVF